ncbi:VOC family protein [Parvularcula sp. IMCC14364]|uniref:VOC family protein n=1 Tax=Parvularcula sp. IMCC14364 TaxID=3067902 RepID=UPI002741E062|nr:VOC family protein [Parvularcula sp. IMCC14364]
MPGQNIGHILWTDLTVPDADNVRAFYEAVIGWSSQPVEMAGRTDFSMVAPGDTPGKPAEHANVVAGICNKVGELADFPSQWLLYFGVADLGESLAACDRLGGKRLTKVITMGASNFCVIEDPAGAVCGLFESNPQDGN